jgi:RNA-directed DNA polymerase
MKSVARRVVDRHVLRLIKMWLRAPIEERDDDDRKRRISGGKSNARGTPQGGVVSPLLANIYMNRFLKYWRLCGCSEAFRARVVAYADDFVILSRGRAAEALAWTKAVMTRLGLTINEAKTSLRNARQERFDFLGYSFGPHYPYGRNGQWYWGASPSKKSMQRLKAKVRDLLVPGNHDPWREVRDMLNRILRAGRTTSATGRAGRPSVVSTSMSASASVPSSSDGTKWQGVATTDSHWPYCMGNVECCAWNACPEMPCRVSCDETSRRAGCRRSARPVR